MKRIVVILLAGFLGASLAAEPLRVVSYQGGHPPFMFPEGDATSGIYRDIFDRITERTGVEFETVHLPFPRAQKMFDAGQIHVEPGINPVWRGDAEVPGLFSRPFADSVDILLFRPGTRRDVEVAADLAGQAVGTIQGYVYPLFTEAFENGSVVRDDAIEERGVLEKLVAGRYDVAILNDAIARFWRKRHPEFEDFEIGDVVGQAEIMFRVHPSRAEELAKIDAALEEMIAAGEIEAIYAKYR